jgi:hypothetical protein
MTVVFLFGILIYFVKTHWQEEADEENKTTADQNKNDKVMTILN